MQPVSQAVIRKMPTHGGNSLGLGPESGNQICTLPSSHSYSSSTANTSLTGLGLTLGWHNAVDDPVMLAAGEAFLKETIVYLKSQPDYQKFLYLNYAAPSQDPIASYGDVNHAELRRVSGEYDPNQVFQRLVPGGYKLYR